MPTSDPAADPVYTGHRLMPASRRVYIPGSRSDLRVPMREITLVPTKLPNGTDVIEWRQDAGGKFQYEVTTVAALKFKARDIHEIRNEVVPGVKGPGRVVVFMETHDIAALPNELQDIILHNANNKIAEKRQADMDFENGAWAFHNIEQ